jgi:chromosome segregation ATPase
MNSHACATTPDRPRSSRPRRHAKTRPHSPRHASLIRSKKLREFAQGLQTKLAEAERERAADAEGLAAIKRENRELANHLTTLSKERDDASADAAAQSKSLSALKPSMDSAQAELLRLRGEAATATTDKTRAIAALEKATTERAEMNERNRQRDALAAAKDGEIEHLKQVIGSAEAAAKNRDTQFQLLTARVDSLTGLAAQHEAAAKEAQAVLSKERTARITAEERVQAVERAAAESAERVKKSDAEKASLATEVVRKSAELEVLRNENARAKAALDQAKTQPKPAQASQSAVRVPSAPTEREGALEAERDALAAALDRAKQHVGVLQVRRDMLRDEVANLRGRVGIGEKVTSAGEKPNAG